MTGEIAKYRLPAPQATIVYNISRGLAHYETSSVHNKSVLAVILKVGTCLSSVHLAPIAAVHLTINSITISISNVVNF